MSAKKSNLTLPAAIKPGAKVEELIVAFLSLASNATPANVIEACKLITDKRAKTDIFLLAHLCCMGNKEVADACAKAMGLSLPAEWQSKSKNGDINFTIFAMLGHMLFMLSPEVTGSVTNRFREAYAKSLGGAKDLKEFGTTGNVPGKDERTKILREWAGRMSTYNPTTHQGDLKAIFPGLFGFAAQRDAVNIAEKVLAIQSVDVFTPVWNLVVFGIIGLFSGPLGFYYALNGVRKRMLFLFVLLLAWFFEFGPMTLQEMSLSFSLSFVYYNLNAAHRVSLTSLDRAAGFTKDKAAKKVILRVKDFLNDTASEAGTFLGEESVREFSEYSWIKLQNVSAEAYTSSTDAILRLTEPPDEESEEDEVPEAEELKPQDDSFDEEESGEEDAQVVEEVLATPESSEAGDLEASEIPSDESTKVEQASSEESLDKLDEDSVDIKSPDAPTDFLVTDESTEREDSAGFSESDSHEAEEEEKSLPEEVLQEENLSTEGQADRNEEEQVEESPSSEEFSEESPEDSAGEYDFSDEETKEDLSLEAEDAGSSILESEGDTGATTEGEERDEAGAEYDDHTLEAAEKAVQQDEAAEVESSEKEVSEALTSYMEENDISILEEASEERLSGQEEGKKSTESKNSTKSNQEAKSANKEGERLSSGNQKNEKDNNP